MIFYNSKYKAPDLGDAKVTKRFAFWPKSIGDKIVWLEYYEEIYIYSEQLLTTKEGIYKFNTWVKTNIRCQTR